VAVGLVALTALVAFLTDAAILFTRPFWVDEWFTVLVASRGAPTAVFTDLARGADGGAGLFHLIVWGIHAVGLPLSPIVLRAMSLLCVLAALWLLYVLLRRRVGIDAAVGGVLAVGSHPLVVAHAYEARFYGPWLLCAVFYASSLDRSFAGASRARVTQGLAAVLLCGIHFYGIITLVLMLAGVVAARGVPRVRESLRVLAPSAAGFVTVLAIVPLAMGQRRAYSVRSWIPDFTLGQVGELARELWVAAVPALLVVAVAIAWIIRGRQTAHWRNGITDALRDNPGMVALGALALMPLALAVVSLAGQPSMISRYAITAVLAWGPLAALALHYLGRFPSRVARFLFVWFWLVSYTREVRTKLLFAAEVGRSQAAVARAPGGIPIFSPSVHLMYPIVAESLGGTARLRFLDLPDTLLARLSPGSAVRESRMKYSVIERDLARVHGVLYGFPVLVPPNAADSLPAFLVLGSALRLRPAFEDLTDFANAVFPGRQFTLITPELGLFGRK
jgi:hypothetical protein